MKLNHQKLEKLKNTKIKNPVRFWKKSKFIADYLEDLEKVDYFKEKGFRCKNNI